MTKIDIVKKIIKWFAWFFLVVFIFNAIFLYSKLHSIAAILPALIIIGLVGLFVVREEKKQTTKAEWIIMGIFIVIVVIINLFLLFNPSLADQLMNSLL